VKDKTITRLPVIPRPILSENQRTLKKRVAAYARVSTSSEEQAVSLAAQKDYYEKKIQEHLDWEFVGIYVDSGISGLRTAQREGFKRLLEDCFSGENDLILTKSISRFARNTLDTINTIRQLKAKGIGVYFEKENIATMDSKSEFILTLMSSLAQEESRSLSENVTWGHRKRMADGKVSLAYSHFLGYDRGAEKYTMVINEEQAATVRRIFRMFLQGYAPPTIARILTKDKVPSPAGCDVWGYGPIYSMLSNEKYKGDALLQKVFTVDFLWKKVKKNDGELPQYYVKENHEPIISPWLFDYVQERIEERKTMMGNYSGISTLSNKIRCGVCGSVYVPRPWHSTSYNNRVWRCKNRVKKGPKCPGNNIYDKLLFYVLHDIAREVAQKRNILNAVVEKVASIVDSKKRGTIWEWTRDFQNVDAWQLVSDMDDLAMVIKRVVTSDCGSLEVHWMDDEVSIYKVPKYRPGKNK
jgi:site-specific DNA recombinase